MSATLMTATFPFVFGTQAVLCHLVPFEKCWLMPIRDCIALSAVLAFNDEILVILQDIIIEAHPQKFITSSHMTARHLVLSVSM
jgi:hypothetical protein